MKFSPDTVKKAKELNVYALRGRMLAPPQRAKGTYTDMREIGHIHLDFTGDQRRIIVTDRATMMRWTAPVTSRSLDHMKEVVLHVWNVLKTRKFQLRSVSGDTEFDSLKPWLTEKGIVSHFSDSYRHDSVSECSMNILLGGMRCAVAQLMDDAHVQVDRRFLAWAWQTMVQLSTMAPNEAFNRWREETKSDVKCPMELFGGTPSTRLVGCALWRPVLYKVYHSASNSVKMLPAARYGIIVGMDVVSCRVVVYDPVSGVGVRRSPEAVRCLSWQGIPGHIRRWLAACLANGSKSAGPAYDMDEDVSSLEDDEDDGHAGVATTVAFPPAQQLPKIAIAKEREVRAGGEESGVGSVDPPNSGRVVPVAATAQAQKAVDGSGVGVTRTSVSSGVPASDSAIGSGGEHDLVPSNHDKAIHAKVEKSTSAVAGAATRVSRSGRKVQGDYNALINLAVQMGKDNSMLAWIFGAISSKMAKEKFSREQMDASLERECRQFLDKHAFEPLECGYVDDGSWPSSFLVFAEKAVIGGAEGETKLRSRLVINGSGLLTEHVFAATPRPESFSILTAVAVATGQKLLAADVASAFLNADRHPEDPEFCVVPRDVAAIVCQDHR
jgi:hypothetical protein